MYIYYIYSNCKLVLDDRRIAYKKEHHAEALSQSDIAFREYKAKLEADPNSLQNRVANALRSAEITTYDMYSNSSGDDTEGREQNDSEHKYNDHVDVTVLHGLESSAAGLIESTIAALKAKAIAAAHNGISEIKPNNI